MKNLFLICVIFLFVFCRCNKEECNPITPPTDDRESFEINFLQYSDNNYFIDDVYADTSASLNIYNLYYGSPNPIVTNKYFVKSIEVYKSVNSIYDIEHSIIANAYINLQSRSRDSMYSDELRNNNNGIPGEIELARFILLNEGSDYTFNPATGQINILKPAGNNDIIAAAYVIENESPDYSDDLYFGEFVGELVNHSKSRGVLKLIKPSNLHSDHTIAWKHKLKNVYQIREDAAPIFDLDFDIFLKKSDGTETNKLGNIGLLEIFGFDKLNENAEAIPDGKFDRRIGINYDPRTSQLFFPLLQPFGINIPTELKVFKYQAIYDTLTNYLTLPDNYFILRGKYNHL